MDDKPLSNYQDYKNWMKSKSSLQIQTTRNNQEISKYQETNCNYFLNKVLYLKKGLRASVKMS